MERHGSGYFCANDGKVSRCVVRFMDFDIPRRLTLQSHEWYNYKNTFVRTRRVRRGSALCCAPLGGYIAIQTAAAADCFGQGIAHRPASISHLRTAPETSISDRVLRGARRAFLLRHGAKKRNAHILQYHGEGHGKSA